MRAFEYGIKFGYLEANKVKKSVDEALAKALPNDGYYKKISLSKMKSPRLEKCYDVCFFFFGKHYGIYAEVYPNTDNTGKMKFQNTDATWIIFLNAFGYFGHDSSKAPKDYNPKFDEYVSKIINQIEAETILLHEYDEEEERL